jgi:hypothetical protein
MAAIGMGLIWFGYWAGLTGVSMIKGWNNSPLQLANPVSVATFTTKCYVGAGVFPSGKPGDSGSCGGSSAAGTTYSQSVESGGTIPAGKGAVGGGFGR